MRLERISHASDCGCAAVVALRSRHRPGELLRRHQHDTGYAAIVLSGSYVEAGDTGLHRVGPGHVLSHAPFESHLDRFESSSAEVLNLPLPAKWGGPILGMIENPDAIVRMAERDVGQAVAVLAATVTKCAPAAEDWPDLLAAELLRDPELSLGEWSARARLHPGSLARGFRLQFGITPAEFRSIARTRKAMRHMAELPLSEVAAESGFADQAHMSRAVKRVTGLSPIRLREHLMANDPIGALTLRASSA